jgi:iron donor protein CyaY
VRRRSVDARKTEGAGQICQNGGLMDEREFHRRADEALAGLYKLLLRGAEDGEFEPDFNSGALSIEFEDDGARFVVSPNSPVRQIWVSALSKSYKLDWDDGRGAFVLPDTAATLTELLQDTIGRHLGHDVSL